MGVVSVARGQPGVECPLVSPGPRHQPGELGADTGGGGGRGPRPRHPWPAAAGTRGAAGPGEVRSVIEQPIAAAGP